MITYGSAEILAMPSPDIQSLVARGRPGEELIAASPAWVYEGSAGRMMSMAAFKPGAMLLTSERLAISQKGKLRTVTNEVPLHAILTVEYFAGTAFDSMKHQLIVDSRVGTFGAQFAGKGADPNDGPIWPSVILEAQRQRTSGERSEPPPSSTLADELAQLGRLRSEGVLSESEFAAAKAQLLGTDREPGR